MNNFTIILVSLLIIGIAGTQAQTVLDHSQNSEKIYTAVEQMPEFPGGTDGLTAFLAKTIKYPSASRKNGISGTVYVSFIVKESGKVDSVKILKSVDPDLDNEALRVIQAMPQWKPGTHEGKPVKVIYNLPIKFSLTDKN